MGDLEGELAVVNGDRDRILLEIEERNRRRSIECVSCDDYHEIGELTAIQAHRYVRPHGCSEGDYWRPQELQFVCPKTEVKNRLLFRNYGVSPGDKNDFEAQFIGMYKGLFGEVIDVHEHSITGKFVNNLYVDDNPEEFGLVERAS